MEDVKVSSHDHLDEFVAGGIVHRLRQKAWDKECASVAELSELWEAATLVQRHVILSILMKILDFGNTHGGKSKLINFRYV